MTTPADNVELYAYTTIWYLQTGSNINISSNSGVICADSENEALGFAVKTGKEANPEHSLNHHNIYAIKRGIIEAIYKRQAFGELLSGELAEANNETITEIPVA